MDLIIASNNKGKILEIEQMLKGLDLSVKSMGEVGFDTDIDETGTTFEENAMLKARYIFDRTDEAIVIADDSGLCVDSLGGAPGVYSARYGGGGLTDGERYQLLLKAIDSVQRSEKTARFVCVIAVILPNGNSFTVKGICEGEITDRPYGENGFGYDPVFYLPQYERTMAQLDMEEKNRISHRAKAIVAMRAELEKNGF